MFAMLLRSKWFARATLVPLIFWGIPTARADDDAQRLTAAYNAAGIDIFRQLESAPGNIGISPYSIGTVMAMALSGARGETAAEMAKVLKHQLDRTQIEAANANVRTILNSYDTSSTQPSCAEGLQWTGERCEAPAEANSHPCPPQMRSDGKGGCASIPAPPPSARLLTANALMLIKGSIAKDYADLIKDKYAAEVFQDLR
jgi:serpin (serine protease inhibitor)